MITPILRTKLYIPPPHPNLVPRQSLVERLDEGLWMDRRLTLISAPAGYGKTTLLSEWAHTGTRRPFAWLSLDEGDNDLARFWTYVVAALQTVRPGVGQAAMAALQSTGPAAAGAQPPVEAIVTAVINDIAEGPGADGTACHPLILVLDDFHLIDAQPIHDAVTLFVERLPPVSQGIHLVISSRVDPPLPLSRWRGRGQLSELRAADLRFTSESAAVFLNQVMGLGLSTAQVTALETRTEGWIVGLYMAALSLQREDARRTTEFVSTFTGSHRYALDYLLDEVLLRQPEDIQTFLLQTAILDRLSGPLCDAVRFGEARFAGSSEGAGTAGTRDSQTILEWLEEANLFIFPLDEERRWYRYHHLFADLLRKRLNRADPERLPILHRRASVWYEQADLLEEAVAHALACQDLEHVADLAEQAALRMLVSGKAGVVPGWLDALPREMILARPQLCVYHAWTQYWIGHTDHGKEYLRYLEQNVRALPTVGDGMELTSVPPSAEGRLLAGHVAAVEAFYASVRRDVPRILELAHIARQLLPRGDYMRTLVSIPLATAHGLEGDIAAAERVRLEGSTDALEFGHPFLAVTLLCYVGATQEERGRLHEAIDTCSRALELARGPDGRELPPAGFPLVHLGALALELNDIETAKARILSGIELCVMWGQAANLLGAYGMLAALGLATEDWPRLLAALQEGERIARGLGQDLANVVWLDYYRVRMWLARGDLWSAVRWAQMSGLSADDEVGDRRVWRHIALARVLIAQGIEQPAGPHLEAALGLLARLLRAAERDDWVKATIVISLLQAQALEARGEPEEALSALGRALALAEPGGYVRTFVDEGRSMTRLLYAAAERGIEPAYAGRLLAACANEAEVPAPEPGIEPLSGREMQVLELVAEGLTNREIAQRLFVTPDTVKTHTSNIYAKLNVHSRAQAVVRARAFGFLSPRARKE